MPAQDPSDPRWFRQVLGQYPTGVSVVTAAPDEGPNAGFVVGSFASVSLDPPLIVFFPDKASTSWPKIEQVGHFCVNILSHEQEHLCRQFASKMPDKFEGVSFELAGSGSPILEGSVAWIDCDLESVEAVGDHFAVYGRVRDLNLGSSSLPLLFFQGGYGSFAPLSLVAADPRGALSEQLREVDMVRPEMERLARDLSARCIATAPENEHVVVVASAGGINSTAPATLVGQRLPLLPPTGAVFVAWSDDATIDAWLEPIASPQGRADQLKRIGIVRERGYALGLINEAQRKFASTIDRLAEDPASVDNEDLRSVIPGLAYDPISLTQELKDAIRVITAPVFGPEGDVELALTVYGFPHPAAAGGIEVLIDRVCEAAAAATKKVGGESPRRNFSVPAPTTDPMEE